VNKLNPVKLLSLMVLLSSSMLVNPALAQRPELLAVDSEEIEVLPVQGNIYMIATGGSNIAVMLGDHGLVIVDSGNIEASDNVVDAIKHLSPLPPRFLINTAALPGHLAGNGAIGEIGEALPGNGARQNDLGLPIVGHANGLSVLVTAFADQIPYELWPNNTFFGDKKSLYLNGEAIDMMYQPSAITESDIMVHFRRSDVLVTGDIFDISAYPHFHPELGGSLQGEIDALNRIIDIAVPEFNQQGGTLIVPGHGRIASESDVVEYRDMLTIVRDRVRLMVNEGKSFEEVLAARPSLEYDGLYGADSGDWTTEMFLEAVYNELR
jgi:glyoxylase-like metal-dependent hydrolase (beta-lactamase superfamily II)